MFLYCSLSFGWKTTSSSVLILPFPLPQRVYGKERVGRCCGRAQLCPSLPLHLIAPPSWVSLGLPLGGQEAIHRAACARWLPQSQLGPAQVPTTVPQSVVKNGMAATEPGRVLDSCLPKNETSDHYTLYWTHCFFPLTKSKTEEPYMPLPVREVKGLAVLSADLLSGAEFPEWHRLRVDFWVLSLEWGRWCHPVAEPTDICS